MSVSRRNARAKLRGLIAARSASAPTDRSAAGFAAIRAWTSRSGSPPRGRGVRADPRLDLTQRLALGGGRGQLRAELRLAAGAAQEHDELLSDLACNCRAEVLLDE